MEHKVLSELPRIAVVVEDEPSGVFRFTYSTEDGEIAGKVCVATGGDEVDSRSLDEKRRAAELRIRALCDCLAEACDENLYADRT
jgi:hypothetical protein